MEILLYVVAGILLGALAMYLLHRNKSVQELQPEPVDPAVQEVRPQALDDKPDEPADYSDERKQLLLQIEELELKVASLEEALTTAQMPKSQEPRAETALAQGDAEVEELRRKLKELQRQVDDLEDEVDDKDDELKRAKRKLSECDAKLEELKPVEQKAKALEAELAVLQEEQDELKRLGEIKAQALSFVREVLTAKEHTSEIHQQSRQSIADFASFVEKDFAPSVKAIYSTLSVEAIDNVLSRQVQSILEALPRWVADRNKYWTKGKVTVAFVGEFSAGKTSIVNRILSQDKEGVSLLPTSSKATTAIPTYVSATSEKAGDNIEFSFVDQGDIRKRITETTFKKICKEVLDEVGGFSSLIKYFVMNYNSEELGNLSILDTPGFSSNDDEDARRTMDVINESDALFWVFDVNNGTVNQSSLHIVQEHLKRPLYVVINKVDSKSPSEVEGVKQLIEKTFLGKGIRVEQFITFSRKSDLSDIMTPLRAVCPTSTSDAFVEHTTQVLEGLSSYLESLIEAKNDALKAEEDSHEEHADNLMSALEWLKSQCGELGDMPKYSSKLFGSDKYEMSLEEHNRFCRIIKSITEGNKETASLIADISHYAKEYKESGERLAKLQEDWQGLMAKLNRIEGLQSKHRNLIHNIK